MPALWRRRGWKEVVLLGALPLVTLVPLAGEMLRGLDQLDVTKLTPPSAALSPATLRDSLVSLFTGTHGLARSAAVRGLQLVVLLGALAGAGTPLWRRPAGEPGASEPVTPEVAAPEMATPEMATPEMAAPEVAAPEVAAPEVVTPEVAAPGAERARGATGAPIAWLAPLDDTRRRIALWLLVATPAIAVILHAFASIPGPEVFDSRYLVGLIPFACALLAAGVDALPWRWAVPAAAACLLALAVAVFVQRYDRELHPDVAPAAELVRESGARTVLTNSPVVAFYLDETDVGNGIDADVRLDRPFGLGNEEPACVAPSCPRPLAIVEDGRLPGGVRAGPGAATPTGPIVVRIAP